MPECAFKQTLNPAGRESVAAVSRSAVGVRNIRKLVAKAMKERYEELKRARHKKEVDAEETSVEPKMEPRIFL